MTPVKSMPRFQCAYCKHRTTRAPMVKHERNCFWNPNRVCDTCHNTGFVIERDWDREIKTDRACPYCAKCRVAHEEARKSMAEGYESETWERWAKAMEGKA